MAQLKPRRGFRQPDITRICPRQSANSAGIRKIAIFANSWRCASTSVPLRSTFAKLAILRIVALWEPLRATACTRTPTAGSGPGAFFSRPVSIPVCDRLNNQNLGVSPQTPAGDFIPCTPFISARRMAEGDDVSSPSGLSVLVEW